MEKIWSNYSIKGYAMKKNFTIIDFLAILIIIVLLLCLIPPLFETSSYPDFELRCRRKLHYIGQSLLLYKSDFGCNVRFPDENGGKFIAKLYTTRILLEPNVYICRPTDKFDKVGMIKGNPSPEGMSYAGRKNKIQSKYPGLYRPYKGLINTTVASDDWEGLPNHENGKFINFLFADGHTDHKRDRTLDGDNYFEFTKEKNDFLADPLTN